MTTQVTKELQKGDWVLIGTQEASNDASLTQTGLSSDYDIFCVVICNEVPQTNGENLVIQFGDSSGIDSGGSDYVRGKQHIIEGSTTYSYNDTTATDKIIISVSGTGNESDEAYSSILWIMNPGDAGTRNTIFGTVSQHGSAPVLGGGTVMGMRESAIVLDRILIKNVSGNITSGRLTVWGLSHD